LFFINQMTSRRHLFWISVPHEKQSHEPDRHGRPVENDPSASTPTTAPDSPTRGHREILEAISGLMLGLFVAILSSTVVTTSLPGSSPTSAAASRRSPGS